MKKTYSTFLVLLMSLVSFTYSFAQVEWLGNSNDWFDANNWDPAGVPDITDNVVLNPGLPVYPNITGAAEVNDILIESGASVTLMLGGSLTVAGVLVEDNGFLENVAGTCLITDNVAGNDVYEAVAIPNEPTGDANQEFCDNATVTNLAATGDNIQWYEDAVSTTALDGTDALVDGENYFATQTVDGCESEDRFEVTVTINQSPEIDAITDQDVCNEYELPAITGNNLTGSEAYYDDENGAGNQFNAGDMITSTTTLYIYDETNTTPNCTDETSFEVTINVSPEIDALADQEECGSYELPTITGNNLTGSEAYYDDENGAGNQFNAGDMITSTTTLYIYDETNTTPNCTDETSFEVTINVSPEIDALTDQDVCNEYELPAITGNNLTGSEAYYDDENGAGNQFNAGDMITSTATLYIYDETGGSPNCTDETSFEVTINVSPEIDALADQEECGSYELPTITGNNLTGSEAYYDDENGAGNQFNAGDMITSTTTLYIYDETNTTPNCTDETSFEVTINVTPEIDPLTNQEECDEYELPTITGNNLSGNEAYYDAQNSGGTQYNAGDIFNTVGTTTLYIYDETGTTPNCIDETSFDVTINSEFNTTDEITSCGSYTWIDGIEYTESNNTASFTLPSVDGCDSIVHLDLTIASGIDLNVNQVVNSQGTLVLISEQANATYKWLDCDNGLEPITNANNRTFAPTSNGGYAVAISKGNCSDTTSCINISTLDNNVFSQKDVNVYPNPSSGLFNVETPSNEGSIEIIDALGRNVKTVTISSDITKVELNGQNKGVYIFKINQANSSITKRVILE